MSLRERERERESECVCVCMFDPLTHHLMISWREKGFLSATKKRMTIEKGKIVNKVIISDGSSMLLGFSMRFSIGMNHILISLIHHLISNLKFKKGRFEPRSGNVIK